MRIGVGFDDTICRTSEMVTKKMEEYAKEKNIDPLAIMNNDMIKDDFFNEYLPSVYEEVVIKRDVKDVLRRLKNKGNEIYVITSRTNSYVPSVTDVLEVTDRWLKKHDISVDGIFSSAYGEDKAEVCKREKIDLMIDNDPYNYKMITSNGGHCLLFDDREKYDLRKDYVTSWLDAEQYVNDFRKN